MSATPLLHRVALCLALVVTAFVAEGQTTYRWIDPVTGHPVLSDMPPPKNVKDARKSSTAVREEEQTLPYATRQASEKFPVVLYTNRACTSCKEARSLLESRGVPFSERDIVTEQDFIEAARQFGGEVQVPSVSIGRQNLKGFSPGAWNDLLDAAGYPANAPYRVRPAAPETTTAKQ